jgi:hypothetical protein
VIEAVFRSEVLADRYAHLLQRRPQRVVPGIVIVGEAQLGGIVREMDRPCPDLREPSNFGDGEVDVGDS